MTTRLVGAAFRQERKGKPCTYLPQIIKVKIIFYELRYHVSSSFFFLQRYANLPRNKYVKIRFGDYQLQKNYNLQFY